MLPVCMVLQFVFRQHIAELIVVGDLWLYVIWLVCDLFKYNIIVHVLIPSLFFIYSRLSSCVEALQSILYPFSWQHTLIPVLPTSLLDICLSPTPYIVGILRGRDATALPGPIEEVHCLICPLARILRLCETSQLCSLPRSSGCRVTWHVSEQHLFWYLIEKLFILFGFGMYGFSKLDVCNDMRTHLFHDNIWFQKKCLKMRLAIIYQEHGFYMIHCYSV